MEAARHPWPALGTLLVQEGAITTEQLERALEAKRLSPAKRLGEILVEQGATTRAAIARALATQHELEYLELDDAKIQWEAASLLPEPLARRYQAIPVRFLEDGSILVAVADPTNVLQSDELRLALGLSLRVGVSSQDAIEAAIGRVHGQSDEVTEMVEAEEEQSHDGTVLDLDHETPAVVFVNKAIARALDLGASDIHFSPQQGKLVVRSRIDGVVREIAAIGASHAPPVVSRIKIMAGLDIAERRAPQDGRLAIRRGQDTIDVRVAVLPTTHGEKVTLRVLSRMDAPGSLKELGIWPKSAAILEHAVHQPFGAIVVCGPTGSGKTTTLYACLSELNTPDRTIVTIEDPVEYRLPGLDQIEVNARNGLSFAAGLRTILRSDPDVILVGEIRDEETGQIAFRAAMTGHLVLTTLHAQTACAAFQRLLDMEVDGGTIGTAVNCVVSQRLVRRLCSDCAQEYQPDQRELAALGVPAGIDDVPLHRAVGCPECGGTGYRGRLPLFEILPVTEEIAEVVHRPTREVQDIAVQAGMLTLRDDGIRMAVAGITSFDEVRRVVGELFDAAG